MFIEEFDGEIYIPDNTPYQKALQKTTYLGFAAHHDDLEIMAMPGILKAFRQADLSFTGVVLTDGRSSPRAGPYSAYSDEEIMRVRKKEQKKAAYVGEYGALIFLDYSSEVIKDPNHKTNKKIEDAIREILQKTSPEIVYTHNLADKHKTHVAVTLRVIEAIRSLSPKERPQKLYGCEVWRDLDWLPDHEKVVFDLSQGEPLASSLIGVFDSQIHGGKRYDLAIHGRRRAHATFSETHEIDVSSLQGYAMDISPLMKKNGPNITEFVIGAIHRFAKEVEETLSLFAKEQ